MDGLSAIAAWIGENETLLSGVAAIVVVLSFVASPLGAGLRGLIRRWALSSAGFVEASAAATPNTADIPQTPDRDADRPSIAVLPFSPASDDKDSEIFADAMTDDIITALGHVPGFFVTSSNSTFVYKGQSVDTRQIARELDVRYVVEGRMQKAGNDVRINAKLAEARTGDQIWSEQFSGDLSDIFALQDEVTKSIVGQLQPELMQAEWRRGTRTPTEDLDAWTLLHSARMRAFVSFDRLPLEEGIRLAEAALVKDPDYAEAHAFLTESFSQKAATRWSDHPEKDRERGENHCRLAFKLEPENPYVLYCAAFQNMFLGHHETAVEQIERSCKISPNDAMAQAMRGLLLGMGGRGEKGLEALDLSLRLSPRDPRAYWMLMFKGYTHLGLEQYAEAEQILRRSLRLNGEFFWCQAWFATTLAMQQKREEAEEALQKLRRLSPDFELEDMVQNRMAWCGNPTDDRAVLINHQIDSLREIWPS